MFWKRLILIRTNLSGSQDLNHEAGQGLKVVHFKEKEAGRDLRAGTEEEVVIGIFKEPVLEDIETIAKAEEETIVTEGTEILVEMDTIIKENRMSMLTLSLKKLVKKQNLKQMKTLIK